MCINGLQCAGLCVRVTHSFKVTLKWRDHEYACVCNFWLTILVNENRNFLVLNENIM